MNTKDIIKYALIAVGGYLLYRYLSDNGYLSSFGIGTQPALPAAGDTAQPKSSSDTSNGTSTSPAAGTTTTTTRTDTVHETGAPAGKSGKTATAPASSTRDLVSVLSTGDSFLNGGGAAGHGPFDHWNFYYNQTPAGKLQPAPDAGTVGIDPTQSITLDQWWALVSAHGVSGLSGLNSISNWGSALSWLT
jgi:hypothetical protein